MGHSLTEYLEKMETFQLKSIYYDISRPEKLYEYGYALPIIEKILKNRED